MGRLQIYGYEAIMALQEKMYLELYYKHQLGNVQIDETPTRVKA